LLVLLQVRADELQKKTMGMKPKKTASPLLESTNIDMISAFSHRSARLVLSLCKSEARYARFRSLVEQELGGYAAKHLEELRRMVSEHGLSSKPPVNS